MKRGGGLTRRTRLGRGKRIRQRNEKRATKRRAMQFGPQADLCRKSPCCACGTSAPSDPHHHPSRGAGGVDADTAPLCRHCHVLVHALGLPAFEERMGVDLLAEIRRMRRRVRERNAAA